MRKKDGKPSALFLSRTPEEQTGEDFDVWCYVMVRRRGYAPAFVAGKLDVTVNTVQNAIRRVKCGRYGDPRQFDSR